MKKNSISNSEEFLEAAKKGDQKTQTRIIHTYY